MAAPAAPPPAAPSPVPTGWEPGAPVMKLDLRNNPDYHGNTAKQFVKADLAELIPD